MRSVPKELVKACVSWKIIVCFNCSRLLHSFSVLANALNGVPGCKLLGIAMELWGYINGTYTEDFTVRVSEIVHRIKWGSVAQCFVSEPVIHRTIMVCRKMFLDKKHILYVPLLNVWSYSDMACSDCLLAARLWMIYHKNSTTGMLEADYMCLISSNVIFKCRGRMLHIL